MKQLAVVATLVSLFGMIECTNLMLTDNSIVENVGQLHQNWAHSSLEHLLTGVARRTLKQLPRKFRDEFEYCFVTTDANDIQTKANCLARAFDRRASRRASMLQRFQKLFHLKQMKQARSAVPNYPMFHRSKRQASFNTLREDIRPYSSYLEQTGRTQQAPPTISRGFSLLEPKAREFSLVDTMGSLLLHGEMPKPEDPTAQAAERQDYLQWQRLNRLTKMSNAFQASNPYVPRSNRYGPQTQQQHIDEQSTPGHSLLALVDAFAEVAEQNNMSSLALLSPRFLSISANEDNVKKILSPEILSFQEHHHGSIPKIMDALKIKHKDEWLQTLMKLTGANKGVAQVLEWVDKEVDNSTMGEKKRLALAHLKMVETWADYMESFSKRQIKDMDKYGYTFTERRQLDIMFNDHSAYRKGDKQLFPSVGGGRVGKRRALEDEIRRLARGEPQASQHNRAKRQAHTPTTGVPGLLSPALFSPSILAPGALGIAILSPGLFNPSILSPHVLTATVLSPTMFSPGILSPGVLDAVVLSPNAFSPSILSPEVLGPSILSPFMFSPEILSPTVLSPDILGPSIFSGDILGPKVLSPGVLADGKWNADVLTPTILSKRRRRRRSVVVQK